MEWQLLRSRISYRILFVSLLTLNPWAFGYQPPRVLCNNNLRMIGCGLSTYAVDSEGHFPTDLKILFPDHVDDARAFRCPGDSEEGPSYVYLTGLNDKSPDTCIVAFDEKGNHRSGRNVLFKNGDVVWIEEESFLVELSRLLEGEYEGHYSAEANQIAKLVLAGKEKVKVKKTALWRIYLGGLLGLAGVIVASLIYLRIRREFKSRNRRSSSP